jgi:predicted peroxiredoxin
MASEPLGVLLISGGHDRAHYAFSVAAAAAAIGRPTVLMATNQGCRALREDWSGLDDVGRDAVVRRRGLAGLGTLRDTARELGVRLIVCEAGLKAEAIAREDVWQGVEVAGIVTFLESVGTGQIVSL